MLNLNLHKQRTNHTMGSCFDPRFLDLFKRAIFLQKLATILSRPVLPSAVESEYLPTQVISDYLANELRPPFDGILFPSTQAASSGDGSELDKMANTNVVLFNRSSKVKKYPDKTTVKASYMPWEEFRLHFLFVDVDGSNSSESVLKKDKDRPPQKNYPGKNHLISFSNSRPDTLELHKGSLWVHIVNGVAVNSEAYLVTWEEVSESGDNIEV